MTVLVTADLHLSDNPRDAYRHQAMAAIRDIAKKHKVSQILILGDLTEEKDRHGAWLVNAVVRHLDSFAAIANVTVLRGNHDYVNAADPYYAFVSRIDGIAWINNPTKLKINGLGHCLFLPHTNNWKADWDGIDLKGADWVFAHNTVDGATTGHRALSGLDPAMFGTARDYVIAGDIHVPQRVGPVTYVGAPYTIDFGDAYEPRVLLLRNDYVHKKQVNAIPVPGPQKRLIELTSDGLGYLKPNRHEYADEGDIVKIRVTIAANEHAKWAEIRDKARSIAEDAGLIVYSIVPAMGKAKAGKAKRALRSRVTDAELLSQYVKMKGVDDKTAKVGVGLLQGAS